VATIASALFTIPAVTIPVAGAITAYFGAVLMTAIVPAVVAAITRYITALISVLSELNAGRELCRLCCDRCGCCRSEARSHHNDSDDSSADP
jgi:hypothetical protein